MDYAAWNAILFVLKWVFIGLIYLMLSVVLMAVRRELAQRAGGEAASAVSPGSLRVIHPGGDARLKVGRVFNLKVSNSIGTERGNDILVRDGYVSKHHARLRWDGEAWWVEDLGSRNGTFVNRAPVASDSPTRIQDGGTLKVGEVIFEMRE